MVNFLFDSTNVESSVHSCSGTHIYTHAHGICCPKITLLFSFVTSVDSLLDSIKFSKPILTT